jgi:ABC-type sugar transport system permease subunit
MAHNVRDTWTATGVDLKGPAMSQTTLAEPAARARLDRRSASAAAKRILGPDWATAYLFVLPTILLLGGLIAYPFMNAVYLSFTNTVTLQTGPFVGLRNYQTLWNDLAFRQSVRNTVVFTT